MLLLYLAFDNTANYFNYSYFNHLLLTITFIYIYKRGQYHTLVERTTYKQGTKRKHNNGLTYRKQQAPTIQTSKERDRNILSGQVDDALVRCKKIYKNFKKTFYKN
jgi:hypothetical protein